MTEAVAFPRPRRDQLAPSAGVQDLVAYLQIIGLLVWRCVQLVLVLSRGVLPLLALIVGLVANVLAIAAWMHAT